MAVLAAKIMGKTYGARAIGTKSAGNKVATYSHTATLPPAILEKDAVGVFLLNKMPRRVCSPEGTAVSVRKSNRAIKSREFPTLLHQCGLLGRRLRLAEQGSGPDTFVTQVLRMWLADYLEACQRGKPSLARYVDLPETEKQFLRFRAAKSGHASEWSYSTTPWRSHVWLQIAPCSAAFPSSSQRHFDVNYGRSAHRARVGPKAGCPSGSSKCKRPARRHTPQREFG